MKNKIAAGIVLYNSEEKRLIKCLDAICPQVEQIYLVDNGSKNRIRIEKILEKYQRCHIIKNAENRGIAAALNQIMRQAMEDGYRWVVTLDDDSVCDESLVKVLAKNRNIPDVGILCPRAVDEKMTESARINVGQWREVRDCITAGALTSVDAWEKVGGFDERMFIDFVDIDYCASLHGHGYRIFQMPGICVHQQYGNISGSFSIFGRRFYLFNYAPARVYYSVRNQIYFMKKHRTHICLIRQILFLIGYISKRIIFEKNRRKSACAVLKGVRDGIRM